MIAEVLIFVPSVANFRNNWLNDRLAARAPPRWCWRPAPEEACRRISSAAPAECRRGDDRVAGEGARRLLAFNDMPPMVRATFDFQT